MNQREQSAYEMRKFLVAVKKDNGEPSEYVSASGWPCHSEIETAIATEFGTLRILAEPTLCAFWYDTVMGYAFHLSDFSGDLILRAPVKYAEFTEAHFNALIDELVTTIHKCKNEGCTRPAFVHESTNREGQCEQCFIKALDAEFAKARVQEEKRQAKRDAKAKAKGYAYRLTMWIHPKHGGDDYQVEGYFVTMPGTAQIEAIARKRNSAILNDYSVTQL